MCGVSTDTAYHTDVNARNTLREVWNRRAAMLQAGNSTVTPDGWVMVLRDPTLTFNVMGGGLNGTLKKD